MLPSPTCALQHPCLVKQSSVFSHTEGDGDDTDVPETVRVHAPCVACTGPLGAG